MRSKQIVKAYCTNLFNDLEEKIQKDIDKNNYKVISLSICIDDGILLTNHAIVVYEEVENE